MASPAVDDATVDAFVIIANRQINDCLYDDKLIDAGSYLTAHLLKLAGHPFTNGVPTPVGSGPVTSVTVGSVSKTMAGPNLQSGLLAQDPSLALTSYGIIYAGYVMKALPGICVL
jgi:hypothetical protein